LEKNAHIEQPDEKKKLHGSKMRSSRQKRVESYNVINLLLTAEDHIEKHLEGS